MKKRIFSRVLALAMALSLLSTTAFAAECLNTLGDDGGYKYIDGDSGALLGYDVTGEDGTITISYDYYLNDDLVLDKTLVINHGDASIDLNGYNLALNENQVVNTATGTVTGSEKNGSVIKVSGADTSLTVTDKNEDGGYDHGSGTGTISGGFDQAQYGRHEGGGINVDGGASLNLEGGTITNNAANAGGGVYVGKGTVTMSGSAKIDGNLAAHAGGGIYLNTELASRTDERAVLTMNGGTISNNTASGKNASNGIGGGGGGISAVLYQNSPDPNYTAIQINGGTITGNKAEIDGAGIYVSNGKVSISDSVISDNTAKNIQGSGTVQSGGGIFASGSKTSVTITGSTISGNGATQGGGLYAQQGAVVNVNGSAIFGNTAGNAGAGIMVRKGGTTVTVDSGSKVYNNTADKFADDVYKEKDGILYLPAAALMNVTGKDGKPITGWYWDNSSGWGNEEGSFPYTSQDHAVGTGYTGALYLKAAHDRYFDVVYTDGLDDENAAFEDQSYSVENKSAIPLYDGIPTRDGYTFTGWQLADGTEVDLENGTVTGTLTLVAQWEPIPEPEEPAEPVVPEIPGGITVMDAPGGTAIADEEIPLAGLVTLAQLLDALRQHEGVEDVELPVDFQWADHEYAQAICWGIDEALVVDSEEEPLDPDELVTVALLRQVMTSYAANLGTTFEVAIEDEDDMPVMNCDEILTEFYASLEEKDA